MSTKAIERPLRGWIQLLSRRGGGAFATLVLGLLAVGCGPAQSAPVAATRSGAASLSNPSASSGSAATPTPTALTLPQQQPITLAPTASKLCAQQPNQAALSAVPSGAVKTLPPGQFLIEPSGGDGPWLLQPYQKHLSVYGLGFNAPTQSGYVYLSTQRSLPKTVTNAMLCVEYFDAGKTTSSKTGDWLTVQYSGTNAKGPVGGAYDDTTESYALTGTSKWLTASFTLTGINFAQGQPGVGKENSGADMRVEYNAPTYFDRFWLITTGVTPTAALAAMDQKSLEAYITKYQ